MRSAGYFLWHEPDIGQEPQLQPQLDFPFFLFFTSPAMMAAMTAMRTIQIMIVTILSAIHANIFLGSFHISVTSSGLSPEMTARNLVFIML